MDSSTTSIAPVLTPHGRLTLAHEVDAPQLDPEAAHRLQRAFERGSGHGLLQLGAEETSTALPPSFSYWREFGALYVIALCTHPEEKALMPVPSGVDLDRLVLSVPPMTGAEYLTPVVLTSLWKELNAAFRIELAESRRGLQELLNHRNP